MPDITRRLFTSAGMLLPGAVARATAPDRPVRFVLGFPAGSGPDVLARILADGLREAWPAGIVVENRAGAAGAIAAEAVAKTVAADGTALLFGEVGQLAMAPSTYARLSYDPAADFAAITQVAAIDFALVVPANLPVSDLPGYLAWARSQPGLTMGTFGAGTPGHFGAAMLAATARLNVEPVHFRATGDAMTAILNGTVQGMFGTVALLAPHVREGRLKALATTGPARSRLMPAVPTMAELAMPSLGFDAWFGLVAPAATPEPVLAELEMGVLRALAAPATRARIEELGFRIAAAGRAAFATLIREETARWAVIVRETGFKAIE